MTRRQSRDRRSVRLLRLALMPTRFNMCFHRGCQLLDLFIGELARRTHSYSSNSLNWRGSNRFCFWVRFFSHRRSGITSKRSPHQQRRLCKNDNQDPATLVGFIRHMCCLAFSRSFLLQGTVRSASIPEISLLVQAPRRLLPRWLEKGVAHSCRRVSARRWG
jgi:hypothetical protein